MTPGAVRSARKRTKNRPFLFVPLTVEGRRGTSRNGKGDIPKSWLTSTGVTWSFCLAITLTEEVDGLKPA
ncbi:hypothetical protein IMZ48_36700 [Candidatus Bathyarchaeota archaeon]|nr:hypothetical protein [Candidatus Bathyarchaeota archaeon]